MFINDRFPLINDYRTLCYFMQRGLPAVVRRPVEQGGGDVSCYINSIQRESGDGKSWNVTVSLPDHTNLTVFVRTERTMSEAGEQAIARDLDRCDLGMALTTGKVQAKYVRQRRVCLEAIRKMNERDGLANISDEELLASLSE